MSTTETNPFAEPDFSGIEVDDGDELDDATDELDDEISDEADEADEEQDAEDEDEDGDEDEGDGGSDDTVGHGGGSHDADDSHGNSTSGGTALVVLEHVTKAIVDDPDNVEIDVAEGRSGVRLSVHVAPGDMGRVIGRRGRTAQALRTLVRAAAAKDGQEASVDIVD